jgi:hypothetical protein
VAGISDVGESLHILEKSSTADPPKKVHRSGTFEPAKEFCRMSRSCHCLHLFGKVFKPSGGTHQTSSSPPHRGDLQRSCRVPPVSVPTHGLRIIESSLTLGRTKQRHGLAQRKETNVSPASHFGTRVQTAVTTRALDLSKVFRPTVRVPLPVTKKTSDGYLRPKEI